MKKKRAGKAKRLSMDRISALPQPIIEIVLSLLSTREAARTSILSRDWRYKWTTLSTLDFPDFKLHVTNTETNRCTYFNRVHQVLLSHQCPIHELYLEICDDCHRFEFDELMLHLAKNHTVKTLELFGCDTPPVFDFLISVFSLPNLTYLRLTSVELEDDTVFNVIGNITTLVLDDVLISPQSILRLLSNCPSLKSLYLQKYDTHEGEKCTIMELFKCLPRIEHLTFDAHTFLYYSFDLGLVPQELPSVLFHLKYFCLERTLFDDGICIPFLLVLIKCAPNLEKLKLDVEIFDDDDDDGFSVVWEEYSDIWLENLIEFEIEDFTNLKLEMEFVKFILAKSPKLKKLSIILSSVGVSGKERANMLEVLLKSPCASSVRIIYLYSKTLESVNFLEKYC